MTNKPLVRSFSGLYSPKCTHPCLSSPLPSSLPTIHYFYPSYTFLTTFISICLVHYLLAFPIITFVKYDSWWPKVVNTRDTSFGPQLPNYLCTRIELEWFSEENLVCLRAKSLSPLSCTGVLVFYVRTQLSGLANFFSKGSDCKYSRLCETFGLCHNNLLLLLKLGIAIDSM